MGKKRFNLDDNFDDVNSYIETAQDKVPEIPEPKTEVVTNVTPKAEPEIEKPSSTPNEKYRRNITLSEELLWRLNYIKERKNKSREKGDKFITLEGLMYDMVQHCLDTQYASTKKKFEEYKLDEANEDWV